MSTKSTAALERVSETASMEDPTKAKLERQMEETRESLSQTVREIKDTVTEQYESVRQTVSGVLDYREQFQKELVVWSLGALSAGFALGYTIGYADKNTKGSKKKHSQIAAFADSLASELSTVGKTLVMPSLNVKIKELLGFDFAEVLEEMGRATPSRAQKVTKRLPINLPGNLPSKATRKPGVTTKKRVNK